MERELAIFVCLVVALLLFVLFLRKAFPGLTIWPDVRRSLRSNDDQKHRVAKTSLLTIPQRELAEYMMELSEEAYCAGWYLNLEYWLWNAVQNGPVYFGRLDITQEHITKLKQLSNACDGWIVWNDETEETWLPLAEWTRLYNELKKGMKSLLCNSRVDIQKLKD